MRVLPIVETVRVELAVPLAESVTLVGVNDADGPPGETVAARLTTPTKLSTLVTVIVDALDDPWITIK